MKRIIQLGCWILLLSSGAFAQTATLSGTVKDQSGSTGYVWQVTSDDSDTVAVVSSKIKTQTTTQQVSQPIMGGIVGGYKSLATTIQAKNPGEATINFTSKRSDGAVGNSWNVTINVE